MGKEREWEETKNMEYMCTHHADERLSEFQANWNKSTLMVGDHVKTSFTGTTKCGESVTEHMWVYITHMGEEVEGTLDNIPIWIDDMEVGDKVYVTLKEVSAHQPGIKNLTIDHD